MTPAAHLGTLRAHLGTVRANLLCSASSRPVFLRNQSPLVTFCFDDFPRTAYTVGGSILKSFGVHATYYAAPGLIDTANHLGDQLTHNDIHSLVDDGHELGCHTFSHVSCRAHSFRSFENEVLRGRAALHDITGFDPSNFAYPYGHVSLRSKRTIGPLMSSCRGIYGGINQQLTDLNLLRANSLYGDIEQLDHVDLLLTQSVSSQGWIIFYTHDVRSNHSPFGCTPALLDHTVRLAIKKGCRIASVQEALATLSRPPNLERYDKRLL